jgi:hypothetical protein
MLAWTLARRGEHSVDAVERRHLVFEPPGNELAELRSGLGVWGQ